MNTDDGGERFPNEKLDGIQLDSDILGPPLFGDIKSWLESMFHFDDPRDSTLVSLFLLQTRCYRVLPTVFYLFIMGAPGSGKSVLLRSIAMLGHGLLLGNISVPAMARELGRGREVHLESQERVGRSQMAVLYHCACFDEFDAEGDRERHAVMEEMLRHGYRWDGPPYIRWDLERNKAKAWDLYMPKAAAMTSTLNPALASRGFRISAVKFDSPEGYKILLNNRYPKDVEKLNRRLDEWGDAVAREFTLEKIESLECSTEHAERVKAITGQLGLNRATEHALTCATISYLAGIDIARDIQHGVETLAVGNEEYEEEIEELNRVLIHLAEKQTTIEAAETVTIKQAEVRKLINEAREAQRERPLGSKRFAEVYRAAGIRTSWIRNWGGRNVWVIPVKHIQVLKGLLNIPNIPHISEKPVQQTSDVDHVDQVDQPLLAEKIAEAQRLFAEGRDETEIELIVGPAVLKHCHERGLIPRVGGR